MCFIPFVIDFFSQLTLCHFIEFAASKFLWAKENVNRQVIELKTQLKIETFTIVLKIRINKQCGRN